MNIKKKNRRGCLPIYKVDVFVVIAYDDVIEIEICNIRKSPRLNLTGNEKKRSSVHGM